MTDLQDGKDVSQEGNRVPTPQEIYAEIVSNLSALPSRKTWWVAFSGGLDSSILLHAVSRAELAGTSNHPVRALHINHGISPNTEKWVVHCGQQCSELNIPLEVVSVKVTQQGRGTEAAARTARYQVFTDKLAAGDGLLQGHHLNDQAETVLFRLFRGLGLAGLAGMPASRELANGALFRPLLGIPRSHLESRARHWQLSWIDDESNADQNLDRNYIRHSILPLLLNRWPAALRRISVSAGWIREALALTDELAVLDLEKTAIGTDTLNSIAFHALTPLRRKNLFRYWLYQRHLHLTESHVNDLLKAISAGKKRAVQTDIEPCLSLHIDPREITLVDLAKLRAVRHELQWHGERSLATPLGELEFRLQKSSDALPLLREPEEAEKVVVCYRQGGERFRPQGRQGSCTLKKWMQENGIPGWQRPFVPLIFYNEQLAAVADMAIAEDFLATGQGLKVIFHTDDR